MRIVALVLQRQAVDLWHALSLCPARIPASTGNAARPSLPLIAADWHSALQRCYAQLVIDAQRMPAGVQALSSAFAFSSWRPRNS
jgi:hypothetical protein